MHVAAFPSNKSILLVIQFIVVEEVFHKAGLQGTFQGFSNTAEERDVSIISWVEGGRRGRMLPLE